MNKLPSILYLHDRYVRDWEELLSLLNDKKLIQQEQFKQSLLAYIQDGLLENWLRERGKDFKIDKSKIEDSALYQSVLEQLTGKKIEIQKSDFNKVCESVEVKINDNVINDGGYFSFINSQENILSITLVSKTLCNESFNIELIDSTNNKLLKEEHVNWSDMTKGKEKEISFKIKTAVNLKLQIEGNIYGQYYLSSNCSGNIGGHGYVDLGLASGTKWATCYIGAKKPSEEGDYFAWGEIKPKKTFSKENYKVGKNILTDYDFLFKKILVSEKNVDAATVNWGEEWKMPTEEQIEELKEGCTWERTKNFEGTGIAGMIGTSKKNHNSIFFPKAKIMMENSNLSTYYNGAFWSSSQYDYYSAYCFSLDNPVNILHLSCYVGLSIRAVLSK